MEIQQRAAEAKVSGESARLWQPDEGCNLDEWSEDEDIAWGALLGAPVYSSSSEDDEGDAEQASHRRSGKPAESSSLALADSSHQEAEQDENEFVVTEYLISGLKISIKQQPRLGIAHQVWHASLVLTDYFNSSEAFPPTAGGENWWAGKRVVELGAGTGIPGIFLASKGARVVLTDLPDVLPLMKWNVEANAHLLPSPECCDAAPLAWGEEHEHIARPIDVVVASDVVYWEHLFAPLAQTLNDICSPETVVYLSWQKRRKNDRQFFKMIGKHFTSEEIKCKPVDAVQMNPNHLKKTHLFKLKKKPTAIKGVSPGPSKA